MNTKTDTAAQLLGNLDAAEQEQQLSTLRYGVLLRLHKLLEKHNKSLATLISFWERTLGKAAALCIDHMIFELGMLALDDHGDENIRMLAAWVEVAVAILFVPFFTWGVEWLAERKKADDKVLIGLGPDVAGFIEKIAGYLLGWACKGMVRETNRFAEPHGLASASIFAVVFAFMLVLVMSLPIHARAKAVLKQRNALWARFVVLPEKVGVAVGFAWYVLATWPVAYVRDNHASMQLTKFVYSLVWNILIFLIVSKMSIIITLRKESVKETAARAASAEEDSRDSRDPPAVDSIQPIVERSGSVNLFTYVIPGVRQVVDDIEESSENVLLSSLSYVFGWGTRDTLNIFFFGYLMGCDSARKCSQQSNLAFAIGTTFCFSIIAHKMNEETTWSKRDQVTAALCINALSLCIGTASANWVRTSLAAMPDKNIFQDAFLTGFVVIICFFLHSQIKWFQHREEMSNKKDADLHGVTYVHRD